MRSNLSSIDDLAQSQWSLVTREQLIAARYSRASIATLLRSRALRTVRPRVYATVGSQRGWQQDAMALVLASGEGAIASRSSAARLWEFVYLPEDAVEAVIEADSSLGMRGVHRTTILPDE